jgi:CBS-domain-containing membrane protein
MRADQVMTRPAMNSVAGNTYQGTARILTEKKSSALPVVYGRGEILGIVSEVDLIALDSWAGPHPHFTSVHPPATPGEECYGAYSLGGWFGGYKQYGGIPMPGFC